MATKIIQMAKDRILVLDEAKKNILCDLMLVLCLTLGVAALNMLWFSFDHHFPTQDEAGHIMHSIRAKELLSHMHPFSHRWWYQVLTINCLYPPFAYIVNGIFMLCFNPLRAAEQIAVTFFACLMVIAVYAIGRLLTAPRPAAFISACCIAAYPLIAQLGHSFYLDLPEVAMTAIGLLVLLWWRSRNTLRWIRSVAVSVVLVCACLTKQLIAAYLLPVGLYFMVLDLGLGYPLRRPRWKWLSHILAIGLMVACLGLPFVFINYQATPEMVSVATGNSSIKEVHGTYLEKVGLYLHLRGCGDCNGLANKSYKDRVALYLSLLPQIMSPLLLTTFIVALIISGLQVHLRLVPIAISAIGGLILTIGWTGNAIDPRYIAPFLIACAMYSGSLLNRFLYAKNWWQKVFAVFVCIMAAVNYVIYNFVPYPLQLSALFQQPFFVQFYNPPTLTSDWGHALILDTIINADGKSPVYLNILTNMGTLHTHSFELLLKEAGINTISPTTARLYTIMGDKVRFKPEEALRSQWYVWKTGSVGYRFFDKDSEINFNKLVEFIRYSGNYKLMAQKILPDGSTLMLYRRKN